MMDEGVALLAATPLFAGIDPARLRVLVYAATPADVPPGDFLVRQGEHTAAGFLVLAGEAEAWMDDDPDLRLSITRGAFIGEGPMIAGLPHRMNVRATQRLQVLRFARDMFLRVCGEFPELGHTVMANFAERMATITATLHPLLPR